MRFALTDEQRELTAMARRLLADPGHSAPLPPAWGTRPALDRKLWSTLAELGLLGPAVPEEIGGSGAGAVELALVAEEMGAALPSVPYVHAVCAAAILADMATASATASADGAPGELVAEVVGGTAVVVPAWRTFAELVGPAAVGARDGLRFAGEGRVSGSLGALPFGDEADLVLARVAEPVPHGQASLVLIDLRQPAGVRRTARAALDAVEPVADVVFEGAEAEPLGGGVLPARAVSVIRTVLAAELVGTGRRALDDAVAYAKQREQFGRAIGSFQAIKHMLADRHVQLDAARLLVHFAAATLDTVGGDAVAEARTALAAAGMAADAATADGLQTHGGIGFTWEQPAHTLLKRARARRALLGSPARQLDALADELFPATVGTGA